MNKKQRLVVILLVVAVILLMISLIIGISVGNAMDSFEEGRRQVKTSEVGDIRLEIIPSSNSKIFGGLLHGG